MAKNILFLTENLYYGNDSGDQIRINMIINSLRMENNVFIKIIDRFQKYNSFLLSGDNSEFVFFKRSDFKFYRLFQFFIKHFFVPKDIKNQIEEFVTLNNIELVWIDYGFLGNFINIFKGKCKVIYGTHNVESKLYAAQYFQKFNFFALAIYFTYKLHERIFFKKADRLVCVSECDKMIYAKYVHKTKLRIIPNSRPEIRIDEKKSLYDAIFVGSLDNWQNLEGLKWFIESVFPKLVKESKNFSLLVVGRNASKLKDLNIIKVHYDIKIVENPKDVFPYYQNVKICIIPLLNGGGTRIKAIESMMLKVPIVSTTKGVEGLNMVNGRDYLLGDSDTEFAFSIKKLLESSKLREYLSNSAYKLYYDKYSERSFIEKISSLINEFKS